MKQRHIKAKDNIYKELYLSTPKYYNIGILNLVSLEERTAEERKAIALKGNEASIKTRRINKGLRIAKEFIYFEKEYNDIYDNIFSKYSNEDYLSIRNTNRLIALNKKYERQEKRFNEIEKQLKELYSVDLMQLLENQLKAEVNAISYLYKQYEKILRG